MNFLPQSYNKVSLKGQVCKAQKKGLQAILISACSCGMRRAFEEDIEVAAFTSRVSEGG